MPNKTQEYLNLAQQTAKELTRYWENWTDYLTTASRLYKYDFADQLMIYAQRPDATACASFDLWNDRMNRYVRRGSKGIALLDQSSSVPRLHYVFDVSDTGVRRNSRDPEVWQLGPDLVQPVSEMLAREYGVRHERITQQIADICGKLVDSYWDNNSGDILDIVDGSFLMDYDEAGQEFQFKSAAAISITYAVLERCGFEPEGHFDRDDFQAIFSFSTPAAVYALGTAVSECSRDVLRNIERTVKTTIRRRNVERSQYEYEQQERDLLDYRGLSAPEPDPAPAGENTGQVRATAPDLPDEASPGAVQLDASVGNSASAPVGGGANRREPDAADHAGVAETEPGSEQGAVSDGVGAAHEQPESTGRGTGDERADLQLSFFDAHIPTEAEQIESIDQAESEKSPSAFSLSQAEIENALRRGSNFENSKLRIWKIYQLQPDRKLRAKALANEYAPYGPGGSSHTYLDGSSEAISMMNLSALKIDPEFQGKIPPLNFEEEQQLEQNILHEGRLLNPLIIWNGFILDGHTRYRILRKHPFISFQIQEIELDNRYAALSWICQNQLGRRNLDPERKKFLMGKLYESEKLARGGSKERAHDENGRFTSMVQNDPLRAKPLSTCERIAAQNGVGLATVKRAEKYAKGVDAAEDAVPGAREEILTGRIKATDAEITALAKKPKSEIPAALAELRKPKQERQPRKAKTSSSKQASSEIRKSIQGHQRQLTAEERTSLKASIDNRYQERAVANGSLMMCEVQGAKEDFIRRWNTIFKEYPDVFEDSDCRKIIHDLTEDAVQYLLKIKEKTL